MGLPFSKKDIVVSRASGFIFVRRISIDFRVRMSYQIMVFIYEHIYSTYAATVPKTAWKLFL